MEIDIGKDYKLMYVVAWSDPEGPNLSESLAYDELLARGYTAKFIDQTTQLIRAELKASNT